MGLLIHSWVDVGMGWLTGTSDSDVAFKTQG